MILQRLYELALREKLLDEPAFEELPVPYLVTVGDGGEYLGFTPTHGMIPISAKKKDAPPKMVRDKGMVRKVPRAHGNTANQGFARYFADTLPRVLPLVVEEKDQKKADASRATFWTQIDEAADATDDPALRAIQAFGRRFAEFTDRIRADVAKEDPALTDRVTFAYRGKTAGPTVLELDPVRAWFSALHAKLNADKQGDGPTGVCQVTGTVGPIPTSHATKLQGVPGGMSVGVSLISFDKAAFGHYGLDGAENAGLGYAAMDGYLRALDALLKNALPSVRAKGGKSKLVVGGTAFLYWTKEPVESDFMSLLDDPADDPMRQLVDSVHMGRNVANTIDATPFYLLALSGNSARAIVRGYLETTLHDAKANVAKWFADLRIADTGKDFAGTPNDKFSLKTLAAATIPRTGTPPRPDWVKLPDHVAELLLRAALTGGSIPDSVLIACLQRLRAEGSKGFRSNRMALIKLILTRKERSMAEQPDTERAQLDPDERDPAYVFGRLLAVFDQIQYAALGSVNSNVVDKFYGTMSAAPGMIFGRLFANAQNHLKKLRTDGRDKKKKQAVMLDRYLTELRTLLTAAPPKLQHSVQEQARFALGFYHEKAKRLERIAKAKAKREQQAKAE